MRITAQPGKTHMKTRTAILSMKTMMELLIRLQQLRLSGLRAAQNNQPTAGEKNSIRFFRNLVRECLPAEVLVHYDRLKETEAELLECPEVFAMAVLVTAYRSLSPRKRQKLVNHFTATPRVGCGCNGHIATRSARAGGGRLRTTRRQLVAHNGNALDSFDDAIMKPIQPAPSVRHSSTVRLS